MSDWESARGWDGTSKAKGEGRRDEESGLRKKHQRIREEQLERIAAGDAIRVRSLGEWLREEEDALNAECGVWSAEFGMPEQPVEIFPPFWNPGELAVMLGPSGVWKSRLALQIAGAIAGGRRNHENTRTEKNAAAAAVNSEQLTVNSEGEDLRVELGCVGAEQRTTPPYRAPLLRKEGSPDPALVTGHSSPVTSLYLDLERTARQYRERYARNGEVITENGEFRGVDLGLLGDVATPERFRGRRHKFLLAAVNERLRNSDHPLVVIDNLTWLMKGELAEIRSLIKSFRRWVNETGRSMLVLWHSSVGMPLFMQAAKFELADTVFMIGASTMGENIRYLKSLKATRTTAGALMPDFDLRKEVMVLRGDGERFVPVGSSVEAAHHYDYSMEVLEAKRVLLRSKALLPREELKVVPRMVKFLEIDVAA